MAAPPGDPAKLCPAWGVQAACEEDAGVPRSIGTHCVCPRRTPTTWAQLPAGLGALGVQATAPQRAARPRISKSVPWVTGTGKWGMPRGRPRSPGLARSIPRLDALGLTQALPRSPSGGQDPHREQSDSDPGTCPGGRKHAAEVRGSLTRAKRRRRPGVHGGMNGPTAAGQSHDGA